MTNPEELHQQLAKNAQEVMDTLLASGSEDDRKTVAKLLKKLDIMNEKSLELIRLQEERVIKQALLKKFMTELNQEINTILATKKN